MGRTEAIIRDNSVELRADGEIIAIIKGRVINSRQLDSGKTLLDILHQDFNSGVWATSIVDERVKPNG